MSFFSNWKVKWEAFKEFAKEVQNWKQVVCYAIKTAGTVALIWLLLHYSAGSAYQIIVKAMFGG